MFDLIWPFQWKMFSVHHVLLWKTVKSSDGGCKVFIPSPTLSTTVRCQSSERSRGNETDTVLSESFDCHYNAVWSLGLVANCCLVRVTKSNAKMQLCFQLSKRDLLTELSLTAQGVPVFEFLASFLKEQDYLSDSWVGKTFEILD